LKHRSNHLIINKMRLQIDTKAKTIKIDELVNIRELIQILEKLLPKEWKDYSLESGSVIYWPGYPVYIYDRWSPPPVLPWEITTYCATYNVEIN
jgi:hypothetical protein